MTLIADKHCDFNSCFSSDILKSTSEIIKETWNNFLSTSDFMVDNRFRWFFCGRFNSQAGGVGIRFLLDVTTDKRNVVLDSLGEDDDDLDKDSIHAKGMVDE